MDTGSVHIEAQMSSAQLLNAVEQLPPREFSVLVTHMLALRAQRQANPLSESETELLLQINQGIPADLQSRFDKLIQKRQSEIIGPGELEELIQISGHIEELDARRLTALDALARLRGVPLSSLMVSLGIAAPRHA